MGRIEDQVVLAFAPTTNSPGKKDATGAFLPEARAFVRLAKPTSELVLIDNKQPFHLRRRAVLSALDAHVGSGVSSVAFFCHGFRSGLQLGFRLPHIQGLAARISQVCAGVAPVVALYCCSTGADAEGDPLSAPGTGENSFADRLRDRLCMEGAVDCRVMAHTTVAHTTMNPMVVFMDGMGVPDGGVGGYAPVAPGSANWPRWRRTLRDKAATLRYRMPFMTAASIHAELTAVA